METLHLFKKGAQKLEEENNFYMMNNKPIINHIKKFTTFQWLIFIKIIENKTTDELNNIENEGIELHLLTDKNWHLILLDLAIRLSPYDKTNVKFKELPTKFDYRNFISGYLESADYQKNFENDLKRSLNFALSRYGYEQFKNNTPAINDIGRLLKLYHDKKALFKEFFGLTPTQMVCFYLLNNSKHHIYEPFDFNNMLRLLHGYDKNIKKQQLEKFLAVFSINIKNYRIKAKEQGIDKTTVKSKRLVLNYPILALNNNTYFIASINNLQYALTYKIFESLNNLQKNPQVFKTKFGHTFENYIRDLTIFSHKKKFHECDKLIIEAKKNKSEFYLLNNDSTVVIEAKLLHFDEKIILTDSSGYLDKAFEKIIKKALSQIKNCFDSIDVKNKYGIIVIHTHIPLLETYLELYKDKFQYDFLDDIRIISVIDYEILIHNSYESIIEYFKKSKGEYNSRNIRTSFEQKNTFLKQAFDDFISELETKLTLKT